MHSESGNKRGVHRRPRAVAFAVLLLVGVAALVYFVWPGSLAKPASNSTGGAASTPGGTAAVGAAASAPGGTAAVGAAAALTPRNPAHVAAWNAGQGGATLAAIWSSLGMVLMTHSVGQFTQMRQECKSLALNVKTASMQLPIPDVAMQNQYEEAQASLAAGAAKCQASISSHLEGGNMTAVHTNGTLLNTAMSELYIGTRELSSATGKIKKPLRPGPSR